MQESSTSLDRLHDIVEPPPVPWWPPAPGWYFVLVLGCIALVLLGVRIWRHSRANAYRREALNELQNAKSCAEIVELLRRTALAIAPRSQIASLTGDRWADWLSSQVTGSMPDTVRVQLTRSVYADATNGKSTGVSDIAAIRTYAKSWIEQHRVSAIHVSPTDQTKGK